MQRTPTLNLSLSQGLSLPPSSWIALIAISPEILLYINDTDANIMKASPNNDEHMSLRKGGSDEAAT